MAAEDPPPGHFMHHELHHEIAVHHQVPPATLAAFEQAVMDELEQLQEQQNQKMDTRDKVDICMIVLGFVITAVLIWAHWENWAPETGPIPIAGVAFRRMMKL